MDSTAPKTNDEKWKWKLFDGIVAIRAAESIGLIWFSGICLSPATRIHEYINFWAECAGTSQRCARVCECVQCFFFLPRLSSHHTLFDHLHARHLNFTRLESFDLPMADWMHVTQFECGDGFAIIVRAKSMIATEQNTFWMAFVCSSVGMIKVRVPTTFTSEWLSIPWNIVLSMPLLLYCFPLVWRSPMTGYKIIFSGLPRTIIRTASFLRRINYAYPFTHTEKLHCTKRNFIPISAAGLVPSAAGRTGQTHIPSRCNALCLLRSCDAEPMKFHSFRAKVNGAVATAAFIT